HHSSDVGSPTPPILYSLRVHGDLLGSQIDTWITRTVSLPPSGRAVLGGDLNCSESRRGAADPLLCCTQSGAAGVRCTAGFQSGLCPLRVRSGHHPFT